MWYLGYYINQLELKDIASSNRYASWHRVEGFASPRKLVQWLVQNAYRVEAPIDFIVER